MSIDGKSYKQTIKEWEFGKRDHDISRDFAIYNKSWLKNHGEGSDYRAENYALPAVYWNQAEGRISHGYPYTAWLQLGLLYGIGVYTAREQGLIRGSTFITRFWRFHYFDWIKFARRGAVYAWAGGLVAGTIAFGSP